MISDKKPEKKKPARIVPNPLNTGKLRNLPCICDSGQKVKRCCGAPLWMTEDLAKVVRAAIPALMAEHGK